MKDDAQGMAPSFAQRADAVAHGNAIGAASALDGAVVDGEDPRLARLERHDMDPRLHPRPLLGQHQPPAAPSGAGMSQW